MSTLALQLQSVVDRDGAVILNSRRNELTTLDPMGGYIWRKIEEGLNEQEIVRHLALETGEDQGVIQHDVQEFFHDLQARQLLALSDPIQGPLELS